MFAALYPDDVVGLVFVDPTADFLRGGTDEDLRDIFEALGLGAKERDEMRAAQKLNPDTPKPLMAEIRMAQALASEGFPEFKTLPPLSDIPVVVLAGESDAEWPTSMPGLSLDFRRWVRQWQAVRIATLRQFAESLSDGTFVETPNSSHQIQNSEPELVAWAIERATFPSVLRRCERAFTTGGAELLTREYEAIRVVYPAHQIDDEAVNYIGDRLIAIDRRAGVALLELNVKHHPRSSRAHEFLADAYDSDGRRTWRVSSTAEPWHLTRPTKALARSCHHFATDVSGSRVAPSNLGTACSVCAHTATAAKMHTWTLRFCLPINGWEGI